MQRDENGFMGRTTYPESAKLSTIAMGKVAFDVFEYKRVRREYQQEQFMKSLNTVTSDDDYTEVLFKLFEQVRLINDDLDNHMQMQTTKRESIMHLEKILLTENEYNHLLNQVKGEDTTLVEISQKFADLTGETKRILDTIRAKSDARKDAYGIEQGQEDVRSNDHK